MYDAILVLGRGVYKDGSIPDSAKATIEKAIQLYKEGKAEKVIFSGKWSYRCDYIPPKTESQAMADYALEKGLPEDATILEEDSYNTISNIYFIKKNILIPLNFKKIILVSLDPVDKRAFNDLNMVLGPTYTTDLVLADFKFPEDKYISLKNSEEEKFSRKDELYSNINPGDDEEIFQRDRSFLKSRGFLED